MNTMIRKLAAAISLAAIHTGAMLVAQTPGSVTFNTTLTATTGSWGNKHICAAWVTKEDGTFIKTLWLQGITSSRFSWTSTEWTLNCPSWNTARGGPNGSQALDGYTSATAVDYLTTITSPATKANNPVNAVWNCRDASNALVPDGNYKFWVQYGYADAAGPVTTGGLLWTKGTSSFSKSNYAITGTWASKFSNMSVVWVPSTVAPTFTSTTPPAGSQGTAYSHTCTASGSAPITFAVTSGALPTGLTLASSGLISGTPTVAGTFTGTITASNGTLPNASQAFSITIAQAIVFTSAAPPSTGNVGSAYNHTCTATGGGTITYSVSSGALPTGLTLSSTGVISGTPGAVGTFTGAIRAANGLVSPVTQNFSIVIGPALVFTPGRVSITATLHDTGFGPDHWCVVWVTNATTGAYVRTIRRQGFEPWDIHWFDHCASWYNAAGLATSSTNYTVAADGFTGATATSYSKPNSPFTQTWNCKDAAGNTVPDGTYRIWIQYAEHDESQPGPVTTNGILWTKGPSGNSVAPADQGTSFTGMSVVWTPSTPFDLWADAAGLSSGQNGPRDAPMGDGVTNLEKYAFNMSASQPDVRTLIVGAGGTIGLPGGAIVGGKLRIEFLRRKSSTNPGITYTPQFSANIGGWDDFTGSPVSVSPVDSTWERVVVDDPLPGSAKRFARVKVGQP